MGMGGHRWNPVGEQNPAYKGGVITDPEWFREHYLTQGLSLRRVAELAGRSMRTAVRWARIHEIPTRPPSSGTHKKGKESPLWKGGPKKCVDCGKQISWTATRCVPCRSKRYRGAGNPNFKGQADISLQLRQYLHLNWRPKVFERDAFTCRRCGDSRGGNLRAHHIHRFSALVDLLVEKGDLVSAASRIAAIDRIADTPKMNDVSNGVTLCEPCHIAVHAMHSGKDRVPIT